MPENVLTIVNLLINKNQQGIQMKYRNETIAKVIELRSILKIMDFFKKSKHFLQFSNFGKKNFF